MASDPVVLYDLNTKQRDVCFSPNTWKTRLVLNYKKVPYKTHWVNHLVLPDIIGPLGVTPNAPPSPPYTVPTITTPSDGTSTMESLSCAKKIESLYPTPSLHLETGLHEKAGALVGAIMGPLMPKLFPKIGRDLIPDVALPLWRSKREQALGKPLEELDASVSREEAWARAKPGLAKLGEFLKENKRDQGPFVLGSQVSYADFSIVNLLAGARIIDEEIFGWMVEADESVKGLWEACAEWVKRDDY